MNTTTKAVVPEATTGVAGRRIVTIKLIRESCGTTSVESQRLRCEACIEKLLKQHTQFKGIIIDSYPKNFICEQVNRDKLTNAPGFFELVKALLDGLPELDNPIDNNTTIYIIAINLLRFGKTKEQIERVTKLLKQVNNNITVEIMPLDFFGYPSLSDAAACHDEFIATNKKIHRDVATPRNQGKNVPSDPATAKEQKFVKHKAKEFKNKFDANDKGLRKMISDGLHLVQIAQTGKPNAHEELVKNEDGEVVSITIGFPFGFERYCEKCVEVFKHVDACRLEGSFREVDFRKMVEILKKYVYPYNGGKKITAVYGRKSPDSRTRVKYDVPVSQMTTNFASMLYHHENTPTPAIFFDNERSRSSWRNNGYLELLALKLSGACEDVYMSLPSRINQRSALIEFDEAVNENMEISWHFTQCIGKDLSQLRNAEEKMHKEQADNVSKFKEARKKLMKNLPEVGKAGVITSEVSDIAYIIGKMNPGRKYELYNVNNADDDCDSIDSVWSLSSCESEEEDEYEA